MGEGTFYPVSSDNPSNYLHQPLTAITIPPLLKI